MTIETDINTAISAATTAVTALEVARKSDPSSFYYAPGRKGRTGSNAVNLENLRGSLKGLANRLEALR